MQRLPWLRPALLAFNVILVVGGVFLFPLIGLLVGLIAVAINEFFTPIMIRRILIQRLEGNLSFSGDLRSRHFRPLPLNPSVLAKHNQLSDYSCIPMAVEFVLKLLGKLPPEDFHLQKAWGNRTDANFSDFDEWTFDEVRFTQQFPQSSHPRGDSFPLDDLFNTIEKELEHPGRYVIVSLATPPHYHNYVIYNRLPNGEFEAVTKGREPEKISNIREQVRNMKGTDILTFSDKTNG